MVTGLKRSQVKLYSYTGKIYLTWWSNNASIHSALYSSAIGLSLAASVWRTQTLALGIFWSPKSHFYTLYVSLLLKGYCFKAQIYKEGESASSAGQATPTILVLRFATIIQIYDIQISATFIYIVINTRYILPAQIVAETSSTSYATLIGAVVPFSGGAVNCRIRAFKYRILKYHVLEISREAYRCKNFVRTVIRVVE